MNNREKGRKKRLDLERKILAHLKRNGTALYDTLSVHFDPDHSAEFQPLLRGLKEYGYIEVTRDKMVTITTFGLQQLESKSR